MSSVFGMHNPGPQNDEGRMAAPEYSIVAERVGIRTHVAGD